jgi:hypothetical protein
MADDRGTDSIRTDRDLDVSQPPEDNTGTILATVFGIWAAIIGGIGVVWAVVALCFLLFFAFIVCIFVCIWLSFAIAIFSAAGSMPQPQPQPGGPPGIPAPNEKPAPMPIPPGWKDADMKRTWLSDLDEFDAKVGWGKFGKKGMLGYGVNPGEADSPITFNGQRNPQGISMAPSAAVVSTVKYRLGRQQKLFKASVACNDLPPGWGGPASPMTFKVWGDGRLLWVSDPVQFVGRKQDVSLNVFGVDVLELQVQCGNNGDCARAIWLDPQVLK